MRFLWLSVVVVALDQATKAAILQFMAAPTGISRSIPLVGDWLRLTFTENPGMAFGITIGPPGTVTVLSLIATCLVAAYLYRIRNGYAPYLWSLSLIFGGAVGNLIDRLRFGTVTDFIDVYVGAWHWPAFNIADSAIVIGVTLMLIESLLPPRKPPGK